MATFELGTGCDEDPIFIGLDNDGNMDRFHTRIIDIHALILFCNERRKRQSRPVFIP